MANTRQQAVFRQPIVKQELVDWMESKGITFVNNDTSVPAISYFLNELKDDLMQKFFTSFATFPCDKIAINDRPEGTISLLFVTMPLYASFHDAEKKTFTAMMVDGAQLYKVNYTGYEVKFKDV